MGLTQSFDFVADDADVCGVDEAGRGPLAGPVVAAAVMLDRGSRSTACATRSCSRSCSACAWRAEIRRKAESVCRCASRATSRSTASTSCKRRCSPWSARCSGCDIVPELVRVDGRQIPAFHDRARLYRAEPDHRRRQSGARDQRGVDSREGVSRPAHAPPASPLPALRLRSEQGLRHRGALARARRSSGRARSTVRRSRPCARSAPSMRDEQFRPPARPHGVFARR